MMTSAMPMIAAMAVNADAERDLPGLHLSEKHAKRRLLMERGPFAHLLLLGARRGRTHGLDPHENAHHHTSHRSLHAPRAHLGHSLVRRTLRRGLFVIRGSYGLLAVLRKLL